MEDCNCDCTATALRLQQHCDCYCDCNSTATATVTATAIVATVICICIIRLLRCIVTASGSLGSVDSPRSFPDSVRIVERLREVCGWRCQHTRWGEGL